MAMIMKLIMFRSMDIIIFMIINMIMTIVDDGPLRGP